MKKAASLMILLLVCFVGLATYAKDKPKTPVETSGNALAEKKRSTKIKIAKNVPDFSPTTLSLPGYIIEEVTLKLQQRIERDFQKKLKEKNQ